jgi:hypothetical protein
VQPEHAASARSEEGRREHGHDHDGGHEWNHLQR